MGIESESELMRFIAREEGHIDLRRLYNTNETTVACGDPQISSNASWRIVGGVVYLYKNNYLDTYISVRRGKSGILEAHLACGWMYTKGYQTYQGQFDLINETRESVNHLNQIYGSQFIVPQPTHTGSAAPFMIGSINDISFNF